MQRMCHWQAVAHRCFVSARTTRVKAASPAMQGRSKAERLDAGEHAPRWVEQATARSKGMKPLPVGQGAA